MTRVKRGYVARRRRDRIQRLTMGCQRALSRLSRSVQQQAIKTLVYSHRDRNRRKRAFRSLWVVRLNAAARTQGMSYSQLIDRLYESDVLVNRKMLAQTAHFDSQAWHNILFSIKLTPNTDRARLKAGNQAIPYPDEPSNTLHVDQSHPRPNELVVDQDQDQDQEWDLADANNPKLYDVDGARHGWRHKAYWKRAYGQIACYYKQQVDSDWLHDYLNKHLTQLDPVSV